MWRYIKKIIKNLFYNYFITKNDISIVQNFLSRIFIYDCGYKLIRIGDDHDSGYLLPNILNKIKFCFSPGVGKSSSFENHLLKFNIKYFLADGTISKPPTFNHNFLRKNINIYNDNKNITLDSWIKQKLGSKISRNLLLQMDIEGSEIEVLLNVNEKILEKFTILIIEFHHFKFLGIPEFNRLYKEIFNKLFKYFTICHIHPNNCCGLTTFGEYKVPNVMEFTFINNKEVKKKRLVKKIPHDLDQKNVLGKKDVKLPSIFYKKESKV